MDLNFKFLVPSDRPKFKGLTWRTQSRSAKTTKINLENYQKLLSKVDCSRLCRVSMPFWHTTSIWEKEQERISSKQSEIEDLLPLAHASDHFSRCFSQSSGHWNMFPIYKTTCLHSMGNTMYLTWGRLFHSFQHGTYSPGFPDYERKVQELWCNSKTSIVLSSSCWKIIFFSQCP